MSFINETIDQDYYVSTWKTKIPICDSLKKLSCKDFELVLSYAYKTLETLQNNRNSLLFEDALKQIHNEHNNKILEIENNYNLIINNKNNNILKLETNKKELQECYNVLHLNFMNLQNNMNQSIKTDITDTLEKQNIFLSSQITSIQNTFNSQLTIYKEQIYDLNQSLQNYQTQALINQNSSNKGKQGEYTFDELVKQKTKWVLTDTSKIPEACDRQSIIRGCKTLFEIKNYKSKIPNAEIEKFKRNMETHKDAPLGIFVSLHTFITGGHQELIYSEFTSNNQILIYIQKFDSFESDNLFAYLNNFIDIAKLLYTKIHLNPQDIDIQNKVDSIKPILSSSLTQISQMINELNNNKRFLNDTINTHHIKMKNNIDIIKQNIENFIHLFFPTDTTNTYVEENELKKRKT